ncbi:MAG: TIGR03435 family protein [Candidatus Solibacter sp.]
MAFEVISLKLSKIDNSHPQGYRLPSTDIRGLSGNRLTEPYTTLTELMMQAYNVRDYQISGAPDWAGWRGDQFDLVAKTEGSGVPLIAQVRLMLQGLLADRFRLKLHRAAKELPVYNLTIGKRGTKLKEVAADSPGSVYNRQTPSVMRASVETLILVVSSRLDRPVINRTGLSANTYEFKLDQIALAGCDRPEQNKADCVSTLLDEQLGLRLEARKAPIELLVVDHVERPSAD